ncbi:MAG: DUF4019 domain-containing protein [bacterium]|nr:DUF4019 domain-containing protein [bacterium]
MKTVICLAASTLLLLAVLPAAADEAKVKAAREVAEAWLEVVDRGDYDQSWEEAAALFKQQVSITQWKEAMVKYRAPLGRGKIRELTGMQYLTALPTGEKGDFVVMQFATEFEHAEGVETITPMLDKDGKWRVSGYYIR